MTPDVIFVFGSNLSGRHGAGAAFIARLNWGAVTGVGEGRTGNAYALPTKDTRIRTLPLETIGYYWARFYQYASVRPKTQFLITPFGTGLAGYSIAEIRSIMRDQPTRNMWFTGDWYRR